MCTSAVGGNEGPEEKEDTEQEAELKGEMECSALPSRQVRALTPRAYAPCPSCRGRLEGITLSPGYL